MNKERRRKLKPRNREMVQRYKRMKGCQKCGYNKYHGALQLHHTDPTTKDGSPSNYKAIQYQWSPTKIKREVRKCIVLCANCHFEHHAGID